MKREVIRPLLFRPPVFGLPFVSDFSGVVFVMSLYEACVENRTPGEVGLYLLVAMIYTPSMKSGAFSPSLSRTNALRQSRRLPAQRPMRLIFPRTLKRRTSSTFTLNSSSTARLTSILFASGATSNAMTFAPDSRSSVDFSVTSGRRMISLAFIAECLREPVERSLAEHDVAAVDDVVHVDVQRVDELQLRVVARREHRV